MSDENIDLLTENFSTASEEEKLALSSAFEGKATPEEIELLKNSEQNQSETVQKLLQQIIDNQKGIVLYQKGNTYFQNNNSNVVDWTDKFEKVPTFEEIEKNIKDIIASGEVFDTLSPNWKIDIKGGNRVVDKITNQGNFQKLQNSAKKRHNKYVAGIKELINNSNYNHSSKNDKSKEKPNILNYHYFDVNIKIVDKTYLVMLECEENKKVHQGRYAKRSKQSHQNINTLTQKNNNVKIVHLYNIKEIKQPNIYFQSVYHGTPHRFDEFSTEHIGSGEGAQAHGWGLYFAKNRNVSDDYRKKLLDDNYNEHIIFDGEIYSQNNGGWATEDEFFESDTPQAEILNYFVRCENKEKTLEWLKDDYKRALKEYNEYVEENEIDANDIDDYEIELRRDFERFEKAVEYLENAEIKISDGQLYEVDIPEDDVLLDEDKTISKQPQKVQEIIEKIYQDVINGSIKANLEYNLNNTNGRQYYRILSNALGSDEQASKLLNKYGIKGIKYNGRQDGECYVIFDDKAVDVLKTYYQTSSFKQEENNKQIENLPKNIDTNTLSVVKFSNEEIEKFKKSATIKKYYKEHVQGTSITNPDERVGEVFFYGDGLGETINKNYSKNYYILSKIKEIIKNAKYDETEDLKHQRNDGIVKFHVLFAKIDTEKKEQLLRIKIAEDNQGKKFFIVKPVKTNKKGFVKEPNTVNNTFHGDNETITIITGNTNNFNPADNTVYQSENTARGFYQLDKNLITILKDGNVDTVIHEYAHWYLNTLASLEGSSQKVDDALADIRKFLKNDGSKFSEKQHEKFAIFCIISTDIYLAYKNTADFLKLC